LRLKRILVGSSLGALLLCALGLLLFFRNLPDFGFGRPGREKSLSEPVHLRPAETFETWKGRTDLPVGISSRDAAREGATAALRLRVLRGPGDVPLCLAPLVAWNGESGRLTFYDDRSFRVDEANRIEGRKDPLFVELHAGQTLRLDDVAPGAKHPAEADE